MRKLKYIWSYWNGNKYPSHKIVFEWEEILAQQLNLKIRRGNWFVDKYHRAFEKYDLTSLYHALCIKKSLKLDFIMCAQLYKKCEYNKNTIPVIIDYWLDDKEIPAFTEVFKNCPLVLLTNKEVYDILKENKCQLNIEHWPLSFPDYYELKKKDIPDKQYEFTVIGRPNPFFIRLLDKYCENHSDFTYLMNNGEINNRKYINHLGEVVADGNTREDYLNMIKRTKISCYTTPGMDEAKSDTSRFNQVTPRLFEMLANGCMVIGHYPQQGADVLWYELDKIIPNVNNYDEFEKILDSMRVSTFDYDYVKSFLDKHYTSKRAMMLRNILLKHNISL